MANRQSTFEGPAGYRLVVLTLIGPPAAEVRTIQTASPTLDGSANVFVTWEAGTSHTYTVPMSGTGFVNVNWQY